MGISLVSVNQPLSLSYNWEEGVPQYFPTKSHSVSRLWVGPSVFQLGAPPPGTVKWEGARTCYTPPNKTQDLQPTWEILEPEETQSNPSELPRRWMGTRGFCCYQCSTFPQSSGGGEGICSGSLHVGCQNCLLKIKVTTWQQSFIWWERYDFKPGRQRLW